ncbi:nuclear transport factor 2 family protein [Propionivibrio sp.]|uniref:nuclear transport factor 2 family protein n=1 Tax=Propionivibrio sp. TaxID=2212460 RepID=UPI003BF1E629
MDSAFTSYGHGAPCPYHHIRQFAAGLFLASGLACSALCLAAASAPDAAPAQAVSQPGTTAFNAADRMAITNLLGAFIDAMDERNVDLLIQYQTPEFTAEYHVFGSPSVTVVGRENFRAMIAKRFAYFETQGIGRRHIFTPPFFRKQTESSARIVIQYLVTSSTHGQNWRPTSSAKAEFGAVKRAGVWYFDSFTERTDAALDLPLEKMVPAPAPIQPS